MLIPRWKKADIVCREWSRTGVIEYYLVKAVIVDGYESFQGWYFGYDIERGLESEVMLEDWHNPNGDSYICYKLKG